MKKILSAVLAAFLALQPAYAQNAGTVTNHAYAIGKGPGVAGYTSLLCASGQLALGSATDPTCRTMSGDATLSATGVLTLATVNASVGTFGSATQSTQVTFDAKGRATAASSLTVTPTVGSITGLGAGCATWLGTPSSANLRGCLTDESGTGLAYFQGGDLGTPSAGVGSNLTALNASALTLGTVAAARGGAGTVNGALKGDGAGNVAQAACANLSNAGVYCSAAQGQIAGVTSNTLATAGNVGELVLITASGATATVTITIAAPAVVTWTGYKAAIDPTGATTNYTSSPVTFTTTGALPTGIVSGTSYYIIPIDANTFNIATSVTNAMAGTKVTTTGSQSGVQTATNNINLATTVVKDVFGLSLTAGEWDVTGLISYFYAATTTLSYFVSGISSTSGVAGGTGTYVQYGFFGTAPGAGGGLRQEFVMPTQRFSFAGTSTAFGLATSSFGVSVMTATGQLRATRVH